MINAMPRVKDAPMAKPADTPLVDAELANPTASFITMTALAKRLERRSIAPENQPDYAVLSARQSVEIERLQAENAKLRKYCEAMA